MQDINVKFKDLPPEKTVERIREILAGIGVELEEQWNDTGISDCWSVHVFVKGAYPFFANGKGITKALARASAYGEFIERLQCGLLLYKFQSITRDPALNLHSYAPDGKYMTMQELVDAGEWMDCLIETYGGSLTREKLAEQCRIYACADEDKIWTLPFYSVFEDKYVYLPAGFVEHIYSGNGCCAGNTREEAWVHAFSEMMERNCTVRTLTGGKAMPPLPEEMIRQYPTASRILETIRQTGRFDIRLFDFSQGSGFPVIATRMIDRENHSYLVNICADPVLEIAIDRTLTEIFQGRQLKNFRSVHDGSIREESPEIPTAHNVLNQLENGNGLFALDFFAEEVSCQDSCPGFADNREKTNKELLAYMLELYRAMGRPVYVRNYSFLGFPSYQIVVPGFSESRGMKLTEPVCEYGFGDAVHRTFRDVDAADRAELMLMLSFYKKVGSAFSRRSNFAGLAGLPMGHKNKYLLTAVTLACGAWKLGRYAEAMAHLKPVLKMDSLDGEARAYLHCVYRYISLRSAKAPEEKLRIVLEKFYSAGTVERLYACLDNGKTPFDPYLLKCAPGRCGECRYREDCGYALCAEIFARAGSRYRAFENGQAKDVLLR